MASTQPRPDGEPAPLPGTSQVAAGLRARRVPILRTPRVQPLAGIGDVGRAARRFSGMTFLSGTARRAAQAAHRGLSVDRLPIRPPDYWTGYTEEDLGAVTPRQSTGDAALDRLVARRAATRQQATQAAFVRRGLPSTIHRRSRTLAGPMTAPGGMARRLSPAPIVPVPNPANSPQTAAARSPHSASGADARRPGERPRPDARPAAPGSRTSPVPPVAATAARPVAPSAGRAPGSATQEPMVLRAPDGVVAGRSEMLPAAAAAALAAVGGGGASPSAVLPRPAARSMSQAAGTAAAEPARAAVREEAGHASTTAPTWPGDLPEVAAAAPAATTGAGRPVLVRPLLSGYRSPTAWRSIAAGPGIRLLPVSHDVTGRAIGAASTVSGSWADAVRRAATDASAAVRRLPVGGPAVVVRDSDSGDSSRRVSAQPATTGASAAATRAARDHAARPPLTGPGQVAARTPGRVPTSTSWSATTGSPIVLRRRAAGTDVELSAWALPSDVRGDRLTASTGSGLAPTGSRTLEARRPGRWFGRTAAASLGRAAGGGRLPVGPLGPVRWAARADESGIRRSTSPGGSWASAVAAAASVMDGGAPGSATLTLMRGGRTSAGGGAEAAARAGGHHPSGERLRVVAGDAAPRRSLTSAAAPAVDVAPAVQDAGTAAAGASLRRLPSAEAAPVSTFVSAPGAVAAHGLPSVATTLVGATSRGVGDAGPGALGRLTHGVPVARRISLPLAPPALVSPPSSHASSSPTGATARRAASDVAGGVAAGAERGLSLAARPSLPASPAAAGRARAAAGHARAVAGDGHRPAGTWRRAVAAAHANTATPSVASLRRLPVAPAAFSRATPASPASQASVSVGGRRVAGIHATVSRRAARHPGTSAAASDVPSRALPGAAPGRLRPIGMQLPVPAGATPAGSNRRDAWRAAVSRAGTGVGKVDMPMAGGPGAGGPGGPAGARALRPSSPGAAERFREVLDSSGGAVTTAPLPVRFRPLAERIIGRMPVLIATGAASRRALASVGAEAATTSSVIHLPSMPDSSARTASLLAHELTHVAAASPVARFHGGRRDREELEAVAMERIVGRAARTAGSGRGPTSPGTSGLPVAGFVGVRGGTTGPPPPAAASTGAAAATVARSISSEGTIRRTPDASAGSGGGASTIRRSSAAATKSSGGGGAAGAADRLVQRRLDLDGPAERAVRGNEDEQQAHGLSEDDMDAIVRALEQRLLESIERRGGMWRGGF